MKAVIGAILALAAMPAIACDWQVSKQADGMTDKVVCKVYSPSAKVEFYRNGNDRPNVAIASAYTHPAFYLRVDDNEQVSMGDNAWARQKALDAILPQLATGQRLRVRFGDYPDWQEGEAAICNLPELLREC